MRGRFSLTRMSPSILVLTIALWLLPFSFAVHCFVTGNSISGIVSVILFVLFAFVWACCRPSGFDVSETGVKIIFPIWTRNVPVQDISGVCQLSAKGFKEQYGWAMRIGVGGLWGGFGWLWTGKAGLVEFYVSRTDGFVLIERSEKKNILISPESPDEFSKNLLDFIEREQV